jgi:hypothetical protein
MPPQMLGEKFWERKKYVPRVLQLAVGRESEGTLNPLSCHPLLNPIWQRRKGKILILGRISLITFD